MQVKLFPDEKALPETPVAVQRGHIGPIRFAATPTSYPYLCQALEALTTGEDVPSPAAGSQD